MFIDLPPPDPSLEISVASRGYSKGLAQTESAQLVVRGEVAFGNATVGLLWKNVSSPVVDGEAQFNLGYRLRTGGFDLRLTGGYHRQTGRDAPTDDERFEFNLAASRAFGSITPRISATYSPDDFGSTRESLYVEAGAGYRIAAGTTVSANIGRRERSNNTDYTSFNLGISHEIVRQVTVEARYYDTAESALGETYEGRAVGMVRVRF